MFCGVFLFLFFSFRQVVLDCFYFCRDATIALTVGAVSFHRKKKKTLKLAIQLFRFKRKS